MRKAKIIETVAASAVGLAVIIAITAIMSVSYTAWKADYDAIVAGNIKPPKQVLQSIDAALADGKVYYDNNLAAVRSEDLVVTAHYKLGDEDVYEVVEPKNYEVQVPSDFVTNGGTVVVVFKGKKATLDVALVAVALDRIEIEQAPYTVYYKTGAVFSDSGMKVYAVYNDGSRKLLDRSDYTVDVTTPLTSSDSVRTVEYADGDTVKTADVDIEVSDVFADGRVVSVSAADECIALVGTDITEVKPSLKITYESGNSKLIGNDYTVLNPSETLRFGKAYALDVKYNGNPRIVASVPVVVRDHIEAEDTVIVGGKKNTETSYLFEGGKFIADADVTFAGDFSREVNKGNEGSFTTVIESYSDCMASITMRCGNSYTSRDDNGYYWMKPLQINSILDLTVNGEPVQIGNNVVLKGCGPSESNTNTASNYAPLFGVYYEFTFGNVALSAGNNEIKFNFKTSTLGEKNCWGELLSTMNVDWFDVETTGVKVDSDAVLSDIELGYIAIGYGDTLADAVDSVSVIGNMSDGNRVVMDKALFDVEIVSGNVSDGTIFCDTYKFRATLKTDPTVFAEREVTIEHYECIVKSAAIELIDGKVYWVFTFDNVGYTLDDYEFFDGNVTFDIADAAFDRRSATFRIDVTDFAAGQFNPHLRVKGSLYVNGANSNGDIRGDELVFVNGQSLSVGGKTYTLSKKWEMPALIITEAAE